MFTLKIQNESNDILRLTQNESVYQVIGVSGLTPPEAEIFTNSVALLDGANFKSSKLQSREMTITLVINGDVEENRMKLYEFFPVGQKCKIIYSNSSLNVFIEGYCERIENDFFTNQQEAQIAVLCPEPFFKSMVSLYHDISKSLGAFVFPFAIEKEGIDFEVYLAHREEKVINAGNAKTGMTITLTATGNNIVNPVIYNSKTLEHIKLITEMNAGDSIVINTNRGKKSIVKYSQGSMTNELNAFDVGSTWLQLNTGTNYFTYSADTNEQLLKVELNYNLLYKGV